MSAMEHNLFRGERILWEGRPLRHRLLRPADALLVPFSIMWAGFVVFWETIALASISGADPVSMFFPLWGLPFILVGLYLVVGRFVVRAIVSRRTRYVLTDRRLIVTGGLSGNRTESTYLSTLPPPVITERTDGSGNLAFGEFPAVGAFFGGRSRLWSWAVEPSRTPILWDIPDVRRVQEFVASHQTGARPASEL
jgi:hypothetical protein